IIVAVLASATGYITLKKSDQIVVKPTPVINSTPAQTDITRGLSKDSKYTTRSQKVVSQYLSNEEKGQNEGKEETAQQGDQTSTTTSFTTTTPHISSISPATGTYGTRVVLTGTGFTETGNTINFVTPGAVINSINTIMVEDTSSSDGTHL